MKIPPVRVPTSPIGREQTAPIPTPKAPQKEAEKPATHAPNVRKPVAEAPQVPKPVTHAPQAPKPASAAPTPKNDTAILSEQAKDMAARMSGKTAAEEAKESPVVEAREEQGKQG